MEIQVDKKNYQLVIDGKVKDITPKQLKVIEILHGLDGLIKSEEVSEALYKTKEKKQIISVMIYELNRLIPTHNIIISRMRLGIRLNPNFNFKIID